MKDFQVAEQIYHELWNCEYTDMSYTLRDSSVHVKFLERKEDENQETRWLIFESTWSDNGIDRKTLLRLRLGSWNRNFFSNNSSYYIIGYIEDQYHHEISLKRYFPKIDIEEEGQVPFLSSVTYSLRDGQEKNYLRRDFTLDLLKEQDLKIESSKVHLGVWDLFEGTFIDTVNIFVSNILLTTLLKAHYRNSKLINFCGLPVIPENEEKDVNVLLNVWKIAPGRKAEFWGHAQEDSNIFIEWKELGDLNKYETKEKMIDAYKLIYPNLPEPINNSDTLWSFYKHIQIGDVIIANNGFKKIEGIGKVIGNYEYILHEGDDYPHTRKVDWVIKDSVTFDENMFQVKAISPITNEKLELIEKAVLEQVPNGQEKWQMLFGKPKESPFIEDFYQFVQSRGFFFSKELVMRFIYSLKSKPFVILSGISGTGKTKIAQLFFEFMDKSTDQFIAAPLSVFEYKLNPYNFDYQRMIVPQYMAEFLEIVNLQVGAEISLSFEGQMEKALIKEERTGVIRLGFRKRFMKWLRENFVVESKIYIKINDGGNSIEFSKISYAANPVKPHQSTFISVRPDWLDHHGLLGFYNPIIQKYRVTEMLKIMIRAKANPELPFFVLLDEMNLSKVEYYFSDFLSCLESRRIDEFGEIIQEKLVLHEEENELTFVDENGMIYDIPRTMEIPKNLYLIGTVNIDETTYMFSPKVLDRAHIIECNEMDFSAYIQNTTVVNMVKNATQSLSLVEKTSWFTNHGTYHKTLYRKEFMHSPNNMELVSLLEELQQFMMNQGYAFGYRVLDEILTFIVENQNYGGFKDDSALDIMILQKILPKIHGNRTQLEPLLHQLFNFCLVEKLDGTLSAIDLDYDASLFRFPLSAKKVQGMFRQIMRTGYGNFIQ
ncbi:hypothetical protein [Bacillus sp. Cr_A10]|uniref:hypothetical protein n=1 Tax=Bacillus sp. Cr_A10 TaxID=3033993 RepID=UPI0023DC2E30|nr:hypothetical protein [Bacillus sp. Cr_A10]MDF2064946.1 hypothetical protein [Bacillus sp. Cr_A10]